MKKTHQDILLDAKIFIGCWFLIIITGIALISCSTLAGKAVDSILPGNKTGDSLEVDTTVAGKMEAKNKIQVGGHAEGEVRHDSAIDRNTGVINQNNSVTKNIENKGIDPLWLLTAIIPWFLMSPQEILRRIRNLFCQRANEILDQEAEMRMRNIGGNNKRNDE